MLLANPHIPVFATNKRYLNVNVIGEFYLVLRTPHGRGLLHLVTEEID